jgi:hypothetical protein
MIPDGQSDRQARLRSGITRISITLIFNVAMSHHLPNDATSSTSLAMPKAGKSKKKQVRGAH